MSAEARLREQCANWDVSDRVARTREPNALIPVRDALEILGELDRLRATPSEDAADPEAVARAMLAELERQARVWNGGLSDIGVDGGFDLIFLAKAAIAAVEGRDG